MKDLIGGPGTVSGLLLRSGQSAFAAASIGAMVTAHGFSGYTAFCYLIASMGLQMLWSFGLACLDVYALRRKRDLQNPVVVSLFLVGDWVTATLSLAASCSSAGVVVLYARDIDYCRGDMFSPCRGYQISVGLAFTTWALIAISSHVMFWILASIGGSVEVGEALCKSMKPGEKFLSAVQMEMIEETTIDNTLGCKERLACIVAVTVPSSGTPLKPTPKSSAPISFLMEKLRSLLSPFN